ncbi:Piwi domain-containing protein [Gymnopilus junonius]|uniref:Piwi domain-containing protein n=1 Tax=Gymnopilus junonius TaxID=109634 RepID=A0A9P5TN56_GYMJU|nr:Piwi domain-containing protein [Gymnopilus junonius]
MFPSTLGNGKAFPQKTNMTHRLKQLYVNKTHFSLGGLNRYRKVQFFHHLQSVVAPQTFNPRGIYNGQSIAFLRQNIGNMNFTVKIGTTAVVAPGTPGSCQMKFLLTSAEEIKPSTACELYRGGSPQASAATNVIQLVVRQGPNHEENEFINCPAGSLIDSEVTHPTERGFYLQSHAAIQGASRSSHYVVLHNENFQSQLPKIEELAYTFCHVYAKATRSVSIPAPVYYADLVCSRGQFHVEPNANLHFDDTSSSISGFSGGKPNFEAWRDAFKPAYPKISKKMYFI